MNLEVRQWSLRRRVVAGLLAVIAVFGLYLGYTGVRAWVAWRSIDRVEFDLDGSRTALSSIADGHTSTTVAANVDGPVTGYRTFLLIGSDARPPELADKHPGEYADAVLLYLEPEAGQPALVSLPRDLLVMNPCTGAMSKLNTLMEGCGDVVTGPELLAVAVEDFTGLPVDHFGMIGFEGLIRAIDGLGGVDLCVPHALREGRTDILPAGCSRVDGRHVLTFVQSRTTQEFVDGQWRFVEGVSDLSRVSRQQQVLFALLARAKQLRAPNDLAGLLTDLGDALVLDDTLSMGQAVNLAWGLRATPADQIRRIVLPVEATITETGEYAVQATESFLDTLASS